eukprot:4294039-Ditylum_brightwellii.AAC.1
MLMSRIWQIELMWKTWRNFQSESLRAQDLYPHSERSSGIAIHSILFTLRGMEGFRKTFSIIDWRAL